MLDQNHVFDSSELCTSCFSPGGSVDVCPVCGYQKNSKDDQDWNKLYPGTIIHERYVIGRSLGQGGFGITYLGFDLRLKTKLAIKEYYPSGLAVRNTANMTVMNATRDAAEDFRQGMDKFLEEARTVARFEAHPNIVSVRDFFEYNGTAYMVMTYFEGKTMLKYLNECGGVMSFEQAMQILSPIMDALDTIHASGLIHRDISPDNIFMTNSGETKLLDFGAAKSAMALVNQQSHSIVLKKGYSPAEQYQSKGSLGPWTDIYSMAATIYRSVVGTVPPDSIDRLDEDILVPPSQSGVTIPDYAEAALIKALSISPKARPQNMRDFKNALLEMQPSDPSITSEVKTIATHGPSPTKRVANPQRGAGSSQPSTAKVSNILSQDNARSTHSKKAPIAIIAGVSAVIVIGIAGFMFISNENKTTYESTISATSSGSDSVSVGEDPHDLSPADVIRKKAEGGDREAQYKLAVLYQQGKGVPHDTRMAAEWFRKSAEQDYSPAQNDIGTLYMQGIGVPQDYKEGAMWLSKAAKQGNPYAQANLGWLYDTGQGVEEDKVKAVELYQASAAQGNANAQTNLAYMYENGLGIKKDRNKAAELYTKAAAQGVSNAQYMLGLYYEAGIGVPKDRAKAIQWFKKAADQGDEDAINKLKAMGINN